MAPAPIYARNTRIRRIRDTCNKFAKCKKYNSCKPILAILVGPEIRPAGPYFQAPQELQEFVADDTRIPNSCRNQTTRIRILAGSDIQEFKARRALFWSDMPQNKARRALNSCIQDSARIRILVVCVLQELNHAPTPPTVISSSFRSHLNSCKHARRNSCRYLQEFVEFL